MKSDAEIEEDVRGTGMGSDLDASDIAISVKNGVVTLTGFARSYTDKYEAEAAVKRVAGAVGVANDIEVRIPSVDEKTGSGNRSGRGRRNQGPITAFRHRIKVLVKNGWVTLEGEVEWQFQRQTAENAVRRIKGVKGVSNTIQLKPRAEPLEIKRRIQDAFRRSAEWTPIASW